MASSLRRVRLGSTSIRVGRRLPHGGLLLRLDGRSSRATLMPELRHSVARVFVVGRRLLQDSRRRLRLFDALSLLQSHLSTNIRLRELYSGRYGADDVDGAENIRFSV